MERFLVTGVREDVGLAVMARLQALDLDVLGVDRSEVNLANPNAANALLERTCPTHVIHCAACGESGENSEASWDPEAGEAQVRATRSLAESAAQQRLRFLYVSTCQVFNGRSREPYFPSASPDPQTRYGWMHWQGEWAVAEHLETYQIVRPGWLYGAKGDNWVVKSWKLLETGQVVRASTDEMGTPVHVEDLARVIVDLAQREVGGVFHVANAGFCSRWEFLRRAAELRGLDPACVQAALQSDTGWAHCPAWTVLDCTRTWAAGVSAAASWEDGLRHFINHFE
jgi:dTDP-4-dehydrorhamnose reductase